MADAVECDGHTDPFSSIPVESFVPPTSASLEDVLFWNTEVSNMKKEISKLRIGGDALRDKIHSEVSRLQKIRLERFCKSKSA